MADLNVTADMTQVNELRAALEALGPIFGKTVSRIQREQKLLENAFKASTPVIKQAMDESVGAKAQKQLADWGLAQKRRLAIMQESDKIAAKQAVSEKLVTQELLRQREASDELARANAKRVQSQIGGNLGLGAQGISAGASAGAFEGEIERLRQKYDKIYASAKLYESSLNELNRAHAFGVTSTKQHEAAVESLNLEYQNFQNGTAGAMNRFQQSASLGRQRMSEWGVVTQQAGYQVGDFLVQIQSGTNWMVAFGQQATQLVGTLPLVAGQLGLTTAAAIGLSTALGIGIPLITAIGALWMRSGSEGKEALTKMEDAVRSLASETDALAAKWSDLKFGNAFGQTMEDQAIKIAVINDELKALDAQAAAASDRQKLVIQTTISGKEQEIQLAIKELHLLSEANNKRIEAQAQIDKANAINNRMLAVQQAAYAAMTDQYKKQQAAQKAMVEDFAAGLNGVKSILDSINGMQLQVGLQINTVVSGLPDFAQGIWDKMGALGQQTKGAYSQYADTRSQADDPKWAGFKTQEASGGGSTGGGGNARLESLISELQTEQETLAIWYEESQTALQSASDNELAIIGGKHEAMLRLTEEYIKKKSDIEELSNKWSLESAVGGAAEIFGAMGAFNKKALKAQAVFSAGAALISTYQGAAKELEKGTLGFTTAAAVIARGIGFVAAIKSAGDGGGGRRDSGGSGGRGSSTVSPQAQAPSPQTVYIDSLDPGGLYTGQALISLFDALYDENDRRGKVFVVGR